jgi:hypothetical protein
VSNIATEPFYFSSVLEESNKPAWGTCVITKLTTNEATDITFTTAIVSGEITSTIETITERGVLYAITATNANPEIGNTGVLPKLLLAMVQVFLVLLLLIC